MITGPFFIFPAVRRKKNSAIDSALAVVFFRGFLSLRSFQAFFLSNRSLCCCVCDSNYISKGVFMKNRKVWGIFSILLVFGLLFVACPQDVDEEAIDAVAPEITAQPVDGRCPIDGEPTSLSVTATISDDGELSYQWYSNTTEETTGTLIEAATSTTYSPPSNEVKTVYYYVVVTNTNNGATGNKTASVTSNVIKVVIYDPTAAEVPEIKSQPQGGTFYQNEPVTLTVTAEVETGTLSYQWYTGTGTAIDGATDGTYSATFAQDGTYSYYVVVTNTDSNPEKTPSAVTSNVATITIDGSNPFDSLTASITLTVDNSVKKQFIRGVGGMSDQCFIYGNGSWTDDLNVDDIQKMFGHGAQELGLNMFRLLMYPYLEAGIANYTGLYQPGPSGGGKNGLSPMCVYLSSWRNSSHRINWGHGRGQLYLRSSGGDTAGALARKGEGTGRLTAGTGNQDT
jgi:hypothetical protein